jgi:hypothetical protein
MKDYLHQNYLDRERKRARDWLDARKLVLDAVN